MKQLNNDMYACGPEGLPEVIFHSGQTWHLRCTFKHDFFACTGLYHNTDTGQQCVLKLSRLQCFLGTPCAWIGRFLRDRELKILKHLEGIEQIPQSWQAFGKNGLIYEYIEGQSLDEKPALPDDFFLLLGQLLEKIHARNVCYMDLNKRGNIIVGKDGRPYLIDFQISLFLPGRFWAKIRNSLQKEDFYHLLKHKRHFRPDLLDESEWQQYRQTSILIFLHRLIGTPYRKLRRWILRFLYRKHILKPRMNMLPTPENDHRRFLQ